MAVAFRRQGVTAYVVSFFFEGAFMMPSIFAVSYSTLLSISEAKFTFRSLFTTLGSIPPCTRF